MAEADCKSLVNCDVVLCVIASYTKHHPPSKRAIRDMRATNDGTKNESILFLARFRMLNNEYIACSLLPYYIVTRACSILPWILIMGIRCGCVVCVCAKTILLLKRAKRMKKHRYCSADAHDGGVGQCDTLLAHSFP